MQELARRVERHGEGPCLYGGPRTDSWGDRIYLAQAKWILRPEEERIRPGTSRLRCASEAERCSPPLSKAALTGSAALGRIGMQQRHAPPGQGLVVYRVSRHLGMQVGCRALRRNTRATGRHGVVAETGMTASGSWGQATRWIWMAVGYGGG